MKETIKSTVERLGQGLKRISRKKHVSCLIHNEIMYKKLRPAIELLEKDPRIRLWVCFIMPDRITEDSRRKLVRRHRLRRISYRWAQVLPWDLILFPDHGPYFRHIRPKVYTGYGIHAGKKVDGQSYKYGPRSRDHNGRPIYDRMFALHQTEYDMVCRALSNSGS